MVKECVNKVARSPDVCTCSSIVELEKGVAIVEHVAASAVVMVPVVASTVTAKLDAAKMSSIGSTKKVPSAGQLRPCDGGDVTFAMLTVELLLLNLWRRPFVRLWR